MYRNNTCERSRLRTRALAFGIVISFKTLRRVAFSSDRDMEALNSLESSFITTPTDV